MSNKSTIKASNSQFGILEDNQLSETYGIIIIATQMLSFMFLILLTLKDFKWQNKLFKV